MEQTENFSELPRPLDVFRDTPKLVIEKEYIFEIILFLMGIEYILLKKKILSILWFIMTLIWVYLSIQTFESLNIKR
jgi:hypothetical protein